MKKKVFWSLFLFNMTLVFGAFNAYGEWPFSLAYNLCTMKEHPLVSNKIRIKPLFVRLFLSKQRYLTQKRIFLRDVIMSTRTPTSFTMKASSTSGTVTFDPSSYAFSVAATSAGTLSLNPSSGTISLDQSVATTSAPSFTGLSLSNQGQLKLYEATGGGSNYAVLQAPAALSANYTLTLPVDDGTANQVLATDGSGVLSWANAFIQNGNSFGAAAVLGTNDAYGLSFKTNGTTRLSISDAGLTTFSKDIQLDATTVITEGASSYPYIHHTGPTPVTNIFVGDNAGNISVSGGTNSGFGVGALYALTSGTSNTACGRSALTALTTGYDNTAIGSSALASCNTIGVDVGSKNTSIGASSGLNLTTGGINTFIGSGAGLNYTTGSNNISIGNMSSGSGSESNTIRILGGVVAHTACYIDGIYGVSVGASGSLVGITSGHRMGTSATTWDLTGNLVISNAAVPSDLRLTGNTGGTASDWSLLSGYGSVDNISILEQGIGTQLVMNAGGKTAIGQGVSPDGTYRLKVADSSGGYGSLMIGDASAGNAVLQTVSGSPDYLKIGFSGVGGQLDTMRITSTGDLSVNSATIIYRDATTPYIHHTGPKTPITNVFTGDNAGNVTVSGGQNAGFGVGALYNLSSGVSNAACGRAALESVNSGGYNTAVGHNALRAITTVSGLTAVGYSALGANTSGTGNTAVGYNALAAVTTTSGHTAVGYGAGVLLASNTDNTLIGYSAGGNLTSGGTNTFVGSSAGLTVASGSDNVGIGLLTLGSAASGYSATSNVVLGNYAGRYLTTGRENVLVGNSAGAGFTSSETNNIIIGYNNVGIAGESNTIRIQGGTPLTSCYIDGIWLRSCDGGASVYCNSSCKVGAPASSIRFKENIQEIPANKRASDLHPVSFNYKESETKELWYGLIAEEVEKILPELVIKDSENQPTGVKYQHIPVLLLKEIKELRAIIDDLTSRLTALESKA